MRNPTEMELDLMSPQFLNPSRHLGPSSWCLGSSLRRSQSYCVKPQLEEQTNETYEEFEAVEYKTQVVAGINYYIKVRVGDDSYIHIKIFKPLPQQQQSLKLTGYQTDKSKDDELTGF
ncbi:cystatin-A isoform X2 [Eptesicus fuscus]|uniref:cystatin-A isoform X2 n=1 Tax=Eptesicus fuscus TaxID=29078 RepID=UPI0024046CB2|nr:cystatin-A isoform X2 [Eptesicus fuscus]